MKHATPKALDQIEKLLEQIRRIDALTERKRGIFYMKSKAFLHFHEDPAGMFADVRDGEDFRRLRASNAAEWKEVLEAVRAEIARRQ